MQATRQDILDYLRSHGQASVKDLATHLGLASTGIRQHLALLERDRMVAATEERGHVGRPALIFALTPQGDALFPKRYDELANALIDEARTLIGPESLQKLMKGVAARLASTYVARLESLPAPERIRETAAILADRGNVSSFRREGDDYFIEKRTCPFWAVARRNSAVCALDVEFVRRLAGADTRLTTSLLRGDGGCTFRMRFPARDRAP